MTAQETANQEGGTEPSNTEAPAVETTGNDVSADAGAQSESTETAGTPAEDAGSPASSSAAESAPQPDAITSRQKLHDDTVKLIIAARLEGVDVVEFVQAKVAEIAD